MKLTLGWLKTHLETDAGLERIAAALTMLGLEVDAITDRSAALAPFRIAHLVEASPHPGADKLKLCRVETGGGLLQIVCGAPNARSGIKVVLAPIGATIPKSGMVLKPTKIRGVDSEGMLCSASELGLGDDHDGILVLDASAPVGQSFAAWAGLDDPILDLKITANRADCLGVRGIARDLAAAGLGTLKPLDLSRIDGRFRSPIAVSTERTDACPLFVGRSVRGVRNGPSPRWLQDRLIAIGLRPISALVDITNFMTFDLCRPLHVFDAARIEGDLVVRMAEAGETLAALNGKSYALDGEMTVIADQRGVLSLGGLMGGESTGCRPQTTEIFLEAALFDPVRTAATGRRLNLHSDARFRFERGLDPAFVTDAAEIATRMITDLCGGEASDLVVAGAVPTWRRRLRLRPERVSSLGGLAVPVGAITQCLAGLGCAVTDGEGVLSVEPPSFRADIEGEADLVEEVLRLTGYDHIPAVPLARATALPPVALDGPQRRASLVRRVLAGRGLDEAVTFSFMPSSLLTEAGCAYFGEPAEALVLANPISADLDVMRPSILPNLLLAARRNADRGFGDFGLFEIGPIYENDTESGQHEVASGLRIGARIGRDWRQAGRAVDAFDAKEDAIAVLAACGVAVDNLQTARDAPSCYHPGRSGTIRLGPKTVLAHFGEIHPGLLDLADLKGPAAAFEIRLAAIPLPKSDKPRGQPALSPFQSVSRDFAFVVAEDVAAEQVVRAARGVDRRLVTAVRLFDVYRGPGVPDGHKSLAIAVTLQPTEATLTDAEIEAFSASLVAQVAKLTGAVLRG